MNSKLLKILSIGLVVFLFIEIVGTTIIQKSKKKEEERIEERKKHVPNGDLTYYDYGTPADLLPNVEDEEYVENMMYAFSQSILLAKSMDAYEIFGNSISDEMLRMFPFKNESKKGLGKEIYSYITRDMTPTQSSATLKEILKDEFVYVIEIRTLERRDSLRYEIFIENKKITLIKESE